MSDLRVNARDTQAVTIRLSKDDAERILKDKALRVGLVKCSFENRINMSRCFKCWSFDHLADDCNGPDRTNLCFNVQGRSPSQGMRKYRGLPDLRRTRPQGRIREMPYIS
ncbi:hypothetical protein NQ314_013781 [Rhamnusium bicolor]|uniref:Zinc knuckle CX2CX4HX4C domain-containing protein n=1 Tax=Rhamnusium bicolor TaxID=1586634 RepID=A0AAV8X526_9CUCU|nr:hypothetical protein NQ314_013781 [Rhamnusium bicolor]